VKKKGISIELVFELASNATIILRPFDFHPTDQGLSGTVLAARKKRREWQTRIFETELSADA
jgi:hypothetical protein